MQQRFSFLSFLFISMFFTGSVIAVPLQASSVIKVKNGYIDSHFSLSSDGKLLAYITVNVSGKTDLHIKNLSSNKEIVTDITKITDTPEEVKFLTNKNILSIKVKNRSKYDYYFFNSSAKSIGNIKNITDLVLTRFNNKTKTVLSAYNIIKTSTSIIHRTALYEIPDFKRPFKKAQLRTDVRGRMTSPETMDLVFMNYDYTVAIVKIIGKYDKASDSKLPDKEGTYNLFTKKLKDLGAISNNAKWDRESDIFAKHPGFAYFLHLTGVADVSGIKGGDFKAGYGIKKWLKIKYNFRIGRFNFASLSQKKEVIDGFLYFTMAVDPQNPITLQHKRSEPANIHVFKLNVKTGQATDIAEIASKYKVFAWSYGGKKVAMMKLHSNWTIGDNILTIYKIK